MSHPLSHVSLWVYPIGWSTAQFFPIASSPPFSFPMDSATLFVEASY